MDVVERSVRVTLAIIDVCIPVVMIPYWVEPAVLARTAFVMLTPVMSYILILVIVFVVFSVDVVSASKIHTDEFGCLYGVVFPFPECIRYELLILSIVRQYLSFVC